MIITYDYNLEEIKENLTIEQVADMVAELGGEPHIQNDIIVSKTICHNSKNNLDQASHKLYYYDNTHLFRCYTGCEEPTWDIFELVRKVKNLELGVDYQLPQAIEYVAQYFGFSKNAKEEISSSIKKDLEYFQSYNRIKDINLTTQRIELKTYDGSFLKNLPRPLITPWIEDNISKEIMDYYEICYDPKNNGIVIPHRDIDGNLIGIRERTLVKEQAERYGKYMPARFGKKIYAHPLSYNLFGLHQNKNNIQKFKKAFVFESEKAVLQYATMFGQENNLAVAICGSSFINYQAWLLISLGVDEIVVGLDRQYKQLNDDEHKKLVRNLKNIHRKYGNYIKISYLFDKTRLTPYKASPTDCGKDIFLKLFKNRVNLYDM